MKPSNPTLRPWLLALSAAAIFSTTAAVHAAIYDFTGTLGGNWGNGANWEGGAAPTFNNVADLRFGVEVGMANYVSFLGEGNRTVRSLEFGNFGNTSTEVGINLGNGTGGGAIPYILFFDTDMADGFPNAAIKVNSTVSANVTIGTTAVGSIRLADNLAVTNDSNTATLIINSLISQTPGGAKGLIKDGVGVLQIGGANTFTGTTTVNGGVLRIDADSRLGTAPASYVADQLTLDGGTLRPSTSFTMSANRGITLGAGGGSIDIAAGTFNCNGIITGSGSLTTSANAPAQAVNLGRANDYSGSTTVNSGTLRLQPGGTIPSSSNLTINGGGNFNARNTNGWIHTGTITGDGTGYVYLSHGTNATLDGNISGLTKIDVDLDGTNATISGDISGATSVSILSGGAALTLSGNNSYSGNTNVNAGTLTVTADDCLPDTSAVSIDNGTLSLSASVNDATGTLDVNTAASTISLGTGATIAFADSSAVDWTGGILNITGSFVSGSSLRFGTTGGGLTADQLLLITVNGGNGSFSLNADGYLVETAGSGFTAWQDANNTSGALGDDHDNDGVSNGVEYFLGGASDTTGFTALPGVTNTAGTLSITWTKAATGYDGTYGSDFVVETSESLATGSWSTETSGDNVVITGNEVKYTFPAGTKRFARLKVTGP